MRTYKRLLLNFSVTITLFFSSKISNAQADIWIDKDENENYTPRHECSFVQAGNAFVMFGGREKAQKLDLYNFKTNTWRTGKSAPKEFNHFQATFYKGFIWIIGSFKTNKFPKETPADNIWLYHASLNKWIQGPEIPKNRRRGGAGLAIYDNKFYLIGGNTIGHDGGFVNWFDEYNPETNTWTILQDAPEARDHFSAAVIHNKLYAVGGRHSGGHGGVFTPLIKKVDTYDFNTKKWTALNKDLPTPRAAPGVAVFNKKLFVIGGEGEKHGPAFKTVEVYDPKTNSWETKKEAKYPRHGTQAIASGKGIYIAGGSPNRGGGSQLNMEVYNKDKPKTNTLKTSILKTPSTVSIKSNTKKSIAIKNSNGNTGTFIQSIILKGTNKNNFKIISDLNLTLVSPKSKLFLDIEHLNDNKTAVAAIVITYNGGIKNTIHLISK